MVGLKARVHNDRGSTKWEKLRPSDSEKRRSWTDRRSLENKRLRPARSRCPKGNRSRSPVGESSLCQPGVLPSDGSQLDAGMSSRPHTEADDPGAVR
jgi:hypothetical protein